MNAITVTTKLPCLTPNCLNTRGTYSFLCDWCVLQGDAYDFPNHQPPTFEEVLDQDPLSYLTDGDIEALREGNTTQLPKPSLGTPPAHLYVKFRFGDRVKIEDDYHFFFGVRGSVIDYDPGRGENQHFLVEPFGGDYKRWFRADELQHQEK